MYIYFCSYECSALGVSCVRSSVVEIDEEITSEAGVNKLIDAVLVKQRIQSTIIEPIFFKLLCTGDS